MTKKIYFLLLLKGLPAVDGLSYIRNTQYDIYVQAKSVNRNADLFGVILKTTCFESIVLTQYDIY